MKILFSLIFIVSGSLELIAQDKQPGQVNQTADTNSNNNQLFRNRYLQLSFEHGGVLPIDDNPIVNKVLKESNFTGLSLRYGWELSPHSIYSRIYRQPIFGLGFFISTFHNPIIGTPMSVFGYAEIPLTRNQNRWNFTYGIALGVSFHFNPYNNQTNPENLLIGSKFNAYVHLNLQARYVIDKYWQVGAGIGYKHFSNGSSKKPNAGINLAPIEISVQYKINKLNTAKKRSEFPVFKPFFAVTASTSSGIYQDVPGGELIYKNLMSVFAGYQISYKYKVGLGFDLNYTSGGTNRIHTDASDFSKNFSYGISVGWEWYLTDRLYMPLSLGFYLHHNIENAEIKGRYERIGLRYLFFNRHLSVGPGLKAHEGTADIMEFNVGWVFHRDHNQYTR